MSASGSAPASGTTIIDGVEEQEEAVLEHQGGAAPAAAEPDAPFTDFVSIPEILGVLRREDAN